MKNDCFSRYLFHFQDEYSSLQQFSILSSKTHQHHEKIEKLNGEWRGFQQIITPIDNIIDNILLPSLLLSAWEMFANKSDIKSHCTPH